MLPSYLLTAREQMFGSDKVHRYIYIVFFLFRRHIANKVALPYPFFSVLQFNIQRVSFDGGHAVETLDEAKAALWKLIRKGRVPK